MPANYELRKHLRMREAMNTPEANARRAIEVEAAKLAAAERAGKYPVISAENFAEADMFQNKRREYWIKTLSLR